ncbi:hypothetical protein BDW66DRAFT_133109 [Aspergillus desertorum]
MAAAAIASIRYVFFGSIHIVKYLRQPILLPYREETRSTVLKQAPTKPMFENHSLKNPDNLQFAAIRNCKIRRILVDYEAELLSKNPAIRNGYSRIIIGLSQECAACVFCLLGAFILGRNTASKRRGISKG